MVGRIKRQQNLLTVQKGKDNVSGNLKQQTANVNPSQNLIKLRRQVSFLAHQLRGLEKLLNSLSTIRQW